MSLHHSYSAAPYPVRPASPARPRPYLDFEKEEAAVAAAASRHYRGLTWLGRAHRAGGAPAFISVVVVDVISLFLFRLPMAIL